MASEIATIYKIINNLNSDIYVGSTTQTLKKRMTNHKYESIRRTHLPLYELVGKIGWNAFQIVELEQVPIEDRLKREQYYMDLLKPILNTINVLGTCDHGIERAYCKPCGGSQICDHGVQRPTCKPCGGSRICDHGVQRPTCKPCGGSQICDHGIRRDFCKPCGGSQICDHGVHRPTCKPCGGSQICDHGIRRATCKICNPYPCPECGKVFGGKHNMMRHLKETVCVYRSVPSVFDIFPELDE
jgi:hypothetical protein